MVCMRDDTDRQHIFHEAVFIAKKKFQIGGVQRKLCPCLSNLIIWGQSIGLYDALYSLNEHISPQLLLH